METYPKCGKRDHTGKLCQGVMLPIKEETGGQYNGRYFEAILKKEYWKCSECGRNL